MECPVHNNEFSLVCVTCEDKLLCIRCIDKHPKRHDYASLFAVTERVKSENQNLLRNIDEDLSTLKKEIAAVRATQKQQDDLETEENQKINDQREALHSIIDEIADNQLNFSCTQKKKNISVLKEDEAFLTKQLQERVDYRKAIKDALEATDETQMFQQLKTFKPSTPLSFPPTHLESLQFCAGHISKDQIRFMFGRMINSPEEIDVVSDFVGSIRIQSLDTEDYGDRDTAVSSNSDSKRNSIVVPNSNYVSGFTAQDTTNTAVSSNSDSKRNSNLVPNSTYVSGFTAQDTTNTAVSSNSDSKRNSNLVPNSTYVSGFTAQDTTNTAVSSNSDSKRNSNLVPNSTYVSGFTAQDTTNTAVSSNSGSKRNSNLVPYSNYVSGFTAQDTTNTAVSSKFYSKRNSIVVPTSNYVSGFTAQDTTREHKFNSCRDRITLSDSIGCFAYILQRRFPSSIENYMALQFFSRDRFKNSVDFMEFDNGEIMVQCIDENVFTFIEGKLRHFTKMGKTEVFISQTEQVKVTDLIQAVNNSISGVFCYQLGGDEGKRLWIMCEEYTGIQYAKHRIELGLGRIQQTDTRRNRTFATKPQQQIKNNVEKKLEDMAPSIQQSTGSQETCCFCMDKVTDPRRLRCGDVFCFNCIEQHFQYKPTCPICGTVYGKIIGDQPHGTMKITTSRFVRLSGYEKYGLITVNYTFPPGVQGENHPNPGRPYKGKTRSGYLPYNERGVLVSKLLKIAFDRKLVFTIGYSRSTGEEGVVTWNGIHHKTRKDGGPQRFGYPDPTHLDRVMMELAVKGVTEESLGDP